MLDQDQLKLFYQQTPIREAVEEYMYDLLDDMALKDIYAGNDISGYKEAQRLTSKFFSRLQELYGEKDSPNKDNQAR